MKIAICLSGLPRFWTGFPKELFKNADYFLHCWTYSDSSLIKDTGWYKNSEDCVGHDRSWSDPLSISEYFKPKVAIFEEYNKETKQFFKDFSSKFDLADGVGRNSVIPMFYGINRVITSCFTYSIINEVVYDIVIRIRYDVKIEGSIDFVNSSGVFIPNNDDFLGINDQFAYGDMNSMLYYGDLYLRFLEKVIDKTSSSIRLNPETLLKMYLLENPEIKINRFNNHVTVER